MELWCKQGKNAPAELWQNIDISKGIPLQTPVLGYLCYLFAKPLKVIQRMKSCISILVAFFILHMSSAKGQTTFTVSPLLIQEVAPPAEAITGAHTVVRNASPGNKTIRWERQILALNPDTATIQVCDINNCYSSTTATMTYVLVDTALMTVYFNKEEGVEGCAVVRLKFTNVNVPADTVATMFFFNNTCLVDAGEPALPEAGVSLFPNPTFGDFRLSGDAEVAAVRIFSPGGQLVQRIKAVSGQWYSLSQQPAGTYFVVVEDKLGRAFQALEVVKR